MQNRLETLKYFCTAAETLNFREAASRLAISPSVISRVIAELENELNEQLFKRNTRNIKLTNYGEAFYFKAKQLLRDSDNLFQLGKNNQEVAGLVRVTLPNWQLGQVVNKLLTALEDYPDLTVEWLNEMGHRKSIDDQIDIGLRVGLTPEPTFIVRKICDVTDMLVSSPRLIKQLGMPKNIQDLQDRYPFVAQINLETGRMWDFVLNEDITLYPKQIKFKGTDDYHTLQAILSGQSVGLISNLSAAPYLKSGKLIRLFPEISIQSWQLYLYRPYHTVTPARVLKVFDVLYQILCELYQDSK